MGNSGTSWMGGEAHVSLVFPTPAATCQQCIEDLHFTKEISYDLLLAREQSSLDMPATQQIAYAMADIVHSSARIAICLCFPKFLLLHLDDAFPVGKVRATRERHPYFCLPPDVSTWNNSYHGVYRLAHTFHISLKFVSCQPNRGH